MEVKIGRPFKFNIEKVSLDQIDALIEKGTRFSLLEGLDEDEYDDVEEELSSDSTSIYK